MLRNFWKKLVGADKATATLPTTLDELSAVFGEDDEVIRATVPLSEADYALIGSFIQAYCWADLHARRIVNLLRIINRADDEEFASRLNDRAAIVHLKSEAEAMLVFPDAKEGILEAVDILMMHHDRRHELAHWSARRAKAVDGFIALTKAAREAARRGVDITGEGDVLVYAFLPAQALRDECGKLHDHGEYLATVAGFLAEQVAGRATERAE